MSAEPPRLAVLVHEVRSPVAALAAIAQAFPAGSSEEVRRLVELALSTCHAIERLVTDAATMSVRRAQVDVGDVVREAVETAVLRGTVVRDLVEPGLPTVAADRQRLRQAFDNLIANAETHAGGEIVVRASSSDREVVVSVSDRGPGIAPEEQGRVLEPGVRLDPTRPGSGLGLAVVQAIAEAHGAVLRLDSAPGGGSTFSLVLPVGD